jgi:hypothetical protein
MRGVFNGIAIMLLGIALEIFSIAAQWGVFAMVALGVAIIGFLVILYYAAYGLEAKPRKSEETKGYDQRRDTL